jgi:hypothetical protein
MIQVNKKDIKHIYRITNKYIQASIVARTNKMATIERTYTASTAKKTIHPTNDAQWRFNDPENYTDITGYQE